MKEIIPLNSFQEYYAATRLVILLEEKRRTFGVLSEQDADCLHETKERTGDYYGKHYWKLNPRKVK